MTTRTNLFSRYTSFVLAIAAMLAIALSPTAVRAQDGMTVQPTAADKNEGLNAKDFFKMMDDSLGTNFGGVITVFGGCYTSDFSNAAPNSGIAKSGKPVAVLAATDKTKPKECTPAAEAGAPFFTGVIGGFVDVNTGQYTATTTDAFTGGKAGVERDEKAGALKKKKDVEHSTPTATYFSGGDKLTLGGGGKKHAILFMGKPQTVFDWRDFANAYQALVDAGYTDIQAFFGVGKWAGKKDDNTPILTTDTFTPGISVQRDADSYTEYKPGFIVKYTSKQTGKDGKVTDVERPVPFEAATFAKLKAAFAAWKANAKANPNDQYFFAVGTHSTHEAKARDEKSLLTPDKTATGTQKAATKKREAKAGGKASDGNVGQTNTGGPPITIGIGIGGGERRGERRGDGVGRERERGGGFGIGIGGGGLRF